MAQNTPDTAKESHVWTGNTFVLSFSTGESTENYKKFEVFYGCTPKEYRKRESLLARK